jgi:cytochrome c-type biogenesis protein CcmH/NrfG
MRDMAQQGSIASHDPYFSHAATIHLNQNLYVPLCATGSYGAVSCPEQYEGYRNQYVERSAIDFANKLIGKLREKIRNQENNSALRRLEPQKLQLPS